MSYKNTLARSHKSLPSVFITLALSALLLMLTFSSATPSTHAQGPDAPNTPATAWLLTGNNVTATSFLGTKNAQPLVFKTQKVERMRISANGNLGIGTSSPTARAEIAVANEGDLALRLMSGPNAFLDVKPTNTGGRFQTVLNTVNNRDVVLLTGTGKVGIETTAPIARLDTRGGTSNTDYSLAVLSDPGVDNRGGLLLHQNAGQGFILHAQNTAAQSSSYLRFNYIDTSTGATLQPNILAIRGNGNVGIGTINPAYTLDVAGSTNIATGLSSVPFSLAALQAHNGNTSGEAALFRIESASNPNAVLKVIRDASGSNDFLKCVTHNPDNTETQLCHVDSGGTFHSGSDFAEALAAKGGKSSYEPGDVVVLSGNESDQVERSSHPYDVRVAGVYSTRPAVLGEDAASQAELADDIPVAVIGIVPTKVTAENGAIQPGDLLTTSSTPGYAMKAKPIIINGVAIYPTGAILGKALGSLKNGTGMIQVLISLR